MPYKTFKIPGTAVFPLHFPHQSPNAYHVVPNGRAWKLSNQKVACLLLPDCTETSSVLLLLDEPHV